MTFTPQTPTQPGAYWWKPGIAEREAEVLVHVDTHKAGLVAFSCRHNFATLDNLGGLWCRLVAADELEKAWDEASLMERDWETRVLSNNWNDSRAKRVREGRE